LLILITAASKDEPSNQVKEYQKIIEENQRYKVYPYSKGYPQAYPFHKDELGYIWFRKDLNYWNSDRLGSQFFRFDGVDFVDVFEDDQYAKNDIIEGFQPDSKYVYLRGKKCIFRWEGTKCTRFLFPNMTTQSLFRFIKINLYVLVTKDMQNS